MTPKRMAFKLAAACALLLSFSCAAPQQPSTGVAQREPVPAAPQPPPPTVAQPEIPLVPPGEPTTGVTQPERIPTAMKKPPTPVPPKEAPPPEKVPPKPPRLSTVAVWDFDSLSVGASTTPELGEVLASRVTDALSRKGKVTVVERQRLLLALEELNVGSSALVDESTRLRLGKMVGAKMMIFGGYLVSGDKMRLDVRLVNVETGALIKATERTVPAANIPQWLEAAESAANELL